MSFNFADVLAVPESEVDDFFSPFNMDDLLDDQELAESFVELTREMAHQQMDQMLDHLANQIMAQEGVNSEYEISTDGIHRLSEALESALEELRREETIETIPPGILPFQQVAPEPVENLDDLIASALGCEV